MAKTMKAQVVKEPNVMVLADVPVPEIGDNEVLIKVKVCGICGSDWSIYTGKYASDKLPLITGHEFWGEITEVGGKVARVKPGDRVAVDICLTCGTCYFCRSGDNLLCTTFTQLGIHTNGGFAEYVKAPADNCYLLPDGMDDYTAAFVEPLTATIHASKRMNAKIASSIVIIGCGLGILHAALARLRGCAPVIVIGDSEARLAMAKAMGADITIDYRKEDPMQRVMEITDGVGVDYVIEAVGSVKTYEQAFQMLRRGGKLEAFGIAAQGAKAELEPYEFVLGEKKVSGSCAGIGNNWGEAIRLLHYKRIDPSPMFSLAVPLSDLEWALHELRRDPDLVKVFVAPELRERVYFHK
jgi:threonine dehydrogenase-like Zn-dependent dehydrogenase